MAHRDPKKEKKGKKKPTREVPKREPYQKPKNKNWMLQNNKD